MADTITELSISGPSTVNDVNPLTYFPIYILETFPNLKRFLIQETLLSDETFEWHDFLIPQFSGMTLPNLGKNFDSVKVFLFKI